jgi:hypothetical protein
MTTRSAVPSTDCHGWLLTTRSAVPSTDGHGWLLTTLDLVLALQWRLSTHGWAPMVVSLAALNSMVPSPAVPMALSLTALNSTALSSTMRARLTTPVFRRGRFSMYFPPSSSNSLPRFPNTVIARPQVSRRHMLDVSLVLWPELREWSQRRKGWEGFHRLWCIDAFLFDVLRWLDDVASWVANVSVWYVRYQNEKWNRGVQKKSELKILEKVMDRSYWWMQHRLEHSLKINVSDMKKIASEKWDASQRRPAGWSVFEHPYVLQVWEKRGCIYPI